ncbi:MAG: hypothetical protein P8H92_03710 [Paracoccaceae bacterium]|nr:hypothetical protein [Paracoccaceae bacterium]
MNENKPITEGAHEVEFSEEQDSWSILLSCVDAGAANYFIPLVLEGPSKFEIFASGIAADKLLESSIQFENVSEKEWPQLRSLAREIIERISPDLLLCGTSWGMTLDKALTLAATERGIKTVSIVDHWTHFRVRYGDVTDWPEKDDLRFLTDYCIVIDPAASHLAKKAGIEPSRLRVGGSPHLEKMERESLSAILSTEPIVSAKNGILFISERIREDSGALEHSPFDEYTVLEDLVRMAERKSIPLDIKLHPQEDDSKFAEFRSLNTRVYKQLDFAKMVNRYRFVVGMNSMLLIELGMWRNDIISYRPDPDHQSDFMDILPYVTNARNIPELESLLDKPQGKGFSRSLRFQNSCDRVRSILKEVRMIN